MKENQFNTKVGVALAGRNCYYQKVVDRTTAGIPDIIICHTGMFIALELKVDNNQLSKIQTYWRGKVMENGGDYYVLRYLNERGIVQLEHPFKGECKFSSIEAALDFMGLEKRCA